MTEPIAFSMYNWEVKDEGIVIRRSIHKATILGLVLFFVYVLVASYMMMTIPVSPGNSGISEMLVFRAFGVLYLAMLLAFFLLQNRIPVRTVLSADGITSKFLLRRREFDLDSVESLLAERYQTDSMEFPAFGSRLVLNLKSGTNLLLVDLRFVDASDQLKEIEIAFANLVAN